MVRAFFGWFQIGLCVLLASASVAAAATLPAALQKGALLVASPRIIDGRFERSVILLVDAGKNGASGLVLTRPSEMSLSFLLPGLGVKRPDLDRLYYGGPLESRNVFVLARTRRVHPRMHHVIGGTYAVAGVRALGHILGQLAEDEVLRAYSGYTGWAPGQLEDEVARGDWTVVPGDERLIFTSEPGRLWERLRLVGDGEWL